MSAVPESPEQLRERARRLETEARMLYRAADLTDETARLGLARERLTEAAETARSEIPGLAEMAEQAVTIERHAEDRAREATRLAARAAEADQDAARDGTSPAGQAEAVIHRDACAEVARRETAKLAAAAAGREKAETALAAGHRKVRDAVARVAAAEEALTTPRPKMSGETLAACWQEALLARVDPALAAHCEPLGEEELPVVAAMVAAYAGMTGTDRVFAARERARIEASGSWPHQPVMHADGTVSPHRLAIP